MLELVYLRVILDQLVELLDIRVVYQARKSAFLLWRLLAESLEVLQFLLEHFFTHFISFPFICSAHSFGREQTLTN